MRRFIAGAVITLSLALAAAPAFAGAGLQTGFSLDPDDFLIGLQFQARTVGENLLFVPSVEAGFGDVTMIAGNADLHYKLQTSSDLAPYVGGGFTVNWFDWKGGSKTDFGGSFLGGIELQRGMFLEAKFGLSDVPDWKFILGWHQ